MKTIVLQCAAVCVAVCVELMRRGNVPVAAKSRSNFCWLWS